jgi:hypothetical protein
LWILLALLCFCLDFWLFFLAGLPGFCLVLMTSLASQATASAPRRRADAGGWRDEGDGDHLAAAAKQTLRDQVFDSSVDRLIAWAAGEFEAKILDADPVGMVVDRKGADHDPHLVVGLEELRRQVSAERSATSAVHGLAS